MATITVLGAGMMGSALCVPLADRGHLVRLVGTHLDAEIVTSLRKRRNPSEVEARIAADDSAVLRRRARQPR